MGVVSTYKGVGVVALASKGVGTKVVERGSGIR